MTAKNLNLDQALVQAEDRLKEIEPKPPVNFQFSWRQTDFTGLVDHGENGLFLRLCGDICAVPYTSEDYGERQRVMGLLRWTDHADKVRFTASEAKRFLMLAETPLDRTLTASNVISSVTTFLVRLRPYFHLARNLERTVLANAEDSINSPAAS